MNYYEVSEIKNVRKKLSLTQSELAKKSGVSQSLIAKIESDKLDPTYSNATKIFNALDAFQKKKSLQARNFIHKGVVFCHEDDLVRDVIKKMKTHEISQLPVMKDEVVVGVVSESKILDYLMDNNSVDIRAKDVMGEVPPIVSINTEESVISNLLRFFSLVIVQNKGRLRGVITRSDILRKIYA